MDDGGPTLESKLPGDVIEYGEETPLNVPTVEFRLRYIR